MIIKRRSFLKFSTLAFGLTTFSPGSLLSAGKLKFNKYSRIKISLAAYSFRSQFRNGKLTMKEFIEYCDKLQLDGTELTSYFFKSDNDSYLLELRNKCFYLGLDISGTAIGNNFVNPDKEERLKQVKDVKYWIDKALILGAPTIRVFGGGRIPNGYSEKDVYDWVISSMYECVEYASKKGIVLAIENHGGFPTTSKQVIKIIQEINSDWFTGLLTKMKICFLSLFILLKMLLSL